MKKRTFAYFKKNKARKIIENPITADLTSFLQATLELSHNALVKRHIRYSLQNLQSFAA